jgi:pimeloyl-ACP methyl ester carboxylesterase
MVASTSDDVAFVVLLAGPAVSGRENLSLSFAMFAQASPSNDLGVSDFKGLLDRLFDLVSSKSPTPEDQDAAMQLAESVAPHVINEKTNMVLGGADVTAEQFIGFLSSGCLQETFESAPETCLSRLTCPVLALFAEKDKHVSAKENMAAMMRLLEAAGNSDFTVETLAGHNHLFQRCKTGYPDEYFTIDHDISSDVLDRVSDWIAGIVLRKKW